MPVEFWFPTPIYVSMIDSNSLDICQSELNSIINSKEHDLANPWGDTVKTSFKYNNDNNILKNTKTHDIFLKHCKEFLTSIGLYNIIKIKESWFNISETGNFQHFHLHDEYDISGIYYFQADEDNGDLVFQHPSLVNRYHKLTSGLDSKITYKPKTGKIILFPSFLEHSVLHNTSKNKRISIAFNAHLEK